MKWTTGRIAGMALAAVFLTVLPACRRKSETVKSDLQEAGYTMTAEDWFRAASGNDVEALKKFAAGKFPADTKNAAGDSALHAAAAHGAQEAADFLLNRGIPVDVRGASDRTPLMVAVMAGQTEITRWLLRQGADPSLRDAEGFRPLMLAVREGKAGAVAELAPYDRSELDHALLLAALVGRADVIDALTNYGASVYARMEDGRTPLMIAAENGHTEAVKLLLEIGSSRYTTDEEGRTITEIATAAGYPEIAALIARDPLPEELALESPEQIAESMDTFVEGAVAKSTGTTPAGREGSRPVPGSIEGEVLSSPVEEEPLPAGGVTRRPVSGGSFAMPPIVMRHYREKDVPVSVREVQGDQAVVSIAGKSPREVRVRAGEKIPRSNLMVVRVSSRMETSKMTALIQRVNGE
ncbi:MAG: ankyrin repeat domain-containing protein [Verrucomicrobiaceae bacterium]|nr:MAG: ankyrin repeat domain-containing protein [Verrucomicrobiaceae bacterium]